MMLMSMEVYNRTMAKMDLYQQQKKAEDQLLSGTPLRFPLISLWRRWKTSMKNCGIELLPEAQKDIAEMLEYIAVTLCAPTAALKLYYVLLTQFQRLKSFPLSGKELEATNVPLNFLYRWKRVENYLVFYTIDVESKIANIMRVVYRYSNYLTILK